MYALAPMGPRNLPVRTRLAAYKRDIVGELVSASGGQMTKNTAQRIVSKHRAVVNRNFRKAESASSAAFAIMPRITRHERIGSGKSTFTEVITNPLSNGWATLLGLAAVGGIGTAIYYAMKKPDASTGV